MNFDNKFFLIKHHSSIFYAKEIEYHLQSIAESLSNKFRSKTEKKLNDEVFWNRLKVLSNFNETLEALSISFKIQSRFSHLSTQEMLRLKDEHLDPLDYMLAYSLKELKTDYENFKKYSWYRFFWFDNNYKNCIELLKHQYADLLTLKKEYEKACLQRANLYQSIGVERYCDDVIGVFSILINRLELTYPLPISFPLRTGLDDDTRVCLFDWYMKNSDFTEEEIKNFIVPISQNPYHPPLSHQVLDEENDEMLKWYQAIKVRHHLTALVRKKKLVEINEKEENWLILNVFNPVYDLFSSNSISYFLVQLYKKRYWAALLFSSLTYLFISPMLVTASGFYLGQWSTGIVANLLFYGVALFPFWALTIKFSKGILNFVRHFSSVRKVKEIHLSVEKLKSNQKYIANRLSAGILDIPHFNIDTLDDAVSNKISEIDNLIITLKQIRFYEKIGMSRLLNQSLIETIDKLKVQKKCFIKRCELLTIHIAERIKDEILILKKSHDKKMVSRVPKHQLQKLRDFVEKYGHSNTLNLFDVNADVLTPFLKAIEANKFCFKSNNPAICAEPWGGYTLNKPALYGWKSLIKGMVLDKNKRKSALEILYILSGKKIVDATELGSLLLIIQTQNNSSKWYRAIQNHLFLSLDQLLPSTALILNSSKKKLIQSWYKKNSNSIKQAYDYFKFVFEHQDASALEIDDQTLSIYFALLRGAEVAFYSDVASEEVLPFKNHIEEYFKNYNGQNDKAIYYTRFLPNHQRQTIINCVAEKRLQWMLNHTKQVTQINEADIDLFKSPYLYDDSATFDFTNKVIEHSLYHEVWDSDTQNFLKLCKKTGLDSGKLLFWYKAIHQRERDFLQSLNSDIVVDTAFSVNDCAEKNLLNNKNIKMS